MTFCAWPSCSALSMMSAAGRRLRRLYSRAAACSADSALLSLDVRSISMPAHPG